VSKVDTVVRTLAGVTVVGLAGIAGAISYSHMTHLAHQHGETGWRGHMFPLPVDGIEIVASLVLFADKHAGRKPGCLPWAALVAGTGASLAANIAVGGTDWIGRAVSGWPAFALLVPSKCSSDFSTIQMLRRSWMARPSQPTSFRPPSTMRCSTPPDGHFKWVNSRTVIRILRPAGCQRSISLRR
jgi:hypothetical protein